MKYFYFPAKIMIVFVVAFLFSNGIHAVASDENTSVRNILTAYHNALTSGDMDEVEKFVVTDDSFAMVEGKHTNWGWKDYRDNHLTPELKDLAKVAFRLDFKAVKISGDMAYSSFIFNLSPKGDPSKNYGSGRATAILVKTKNGWMIQHLHTS